MKTTASALAEMANDANPTTAFNATASALSQTTSGPDVDAISSFMRVVRAQERIADLGLTE